MRRLLLGSIACAGAIALASPAFAQTPRSITPQGLWRDGPAPPGSGSAGSSRSGEAFRTPVAPGEGTEGESGDDGLDWDPFDGPLEDATGAAEAFETIRDFYESYRRLSETDENWEPDYTPDGSPEVPISCETDACAACYERSINQLNFVRRQFERLRAIYGGAKDFADKSIAFGDTVSGIHGASGLAWQAQKTGIIREVEKLGRTYDSKHEELSAALRRALNDIGACEAEHFSTPDWYNRFGFIYYTFMEDRYRRRD